MSTCWSWTFLFSSFFSFLLSTAGTISGEEVPIVSKTNIKEYRDSFSCEKFTFRSNPNITFYVYVSNFSWPIKIQVRVRHRAHHAAHLYLLPELPCLPNNCAQMVTVLQKKKKKCWKGEAATFVMPTSGWFQVHLIAITHLMSDAQCAAEVHRCFSGQMQSAI